jgi:glutathione S-transferase
MDNSPSSSVCYLDQFLTTEAFDLKDLSQSRQQTDSSTMAASTGDGDNYTVYYNPFSICSIMVRMTLALRGKPASEPAPTFTEHLIDIYKDEQLSESFLTTVNPKGQVPAMTSPALPEPLTDSLDITYHLCDLYPRLGPKEHKETIYRLLKELHQIQYLSLSFTPAQNRAGGITVAVEKLRAQPDISDKYREALEFKAE